MAESKLLTGSTQVRTLINVGLSQPDRGLPMAHEVLGACNKSQRVSSANILSALSTYKLSYKSQRLQVSL